MLQVGKLKDIVTQILFKSGFPQEDSALIADFLLQADLNGISTHGLARLNLYIERAENNALNKQPVVKIIKDTNATTVVDADNGMGIVAAKKAIELVTAKAKEFGIGFATIRNSNHIGALSYLTNIIQKQGFIGFACTNTSPIMAPYGGKDAVLGNNPFSVAVPYNPPIIFDTALSITARGNIILAEREGKKIPEGWAVNDKGQVTTDPKEALLGAVLPMAKHKGYGMALLIDILAGVLSGAQYGTNLGSFVPPDYSKPLGFGHVVMAIDIESFMNKEEFNERLKALVEMIKGSSPAEGFSEIFIPGERSYKNSQQALKEGVQLKETTIAKLKELCAKYQVSGL